MITQKNPNITTTDKTVVPINGKFHLQFICSITEYENVAVVLRRLGFIKATYDDLTPENCGEHYPFSADRREVIFKVPSVTIEEAAFIKQVLRRV